MYALRLRSGGQTGVDRAALDVAVERGVDYCGWCPEGGWAEDCPVAPGVLDRYPRLTATVGRDPAERSRRNVHDADATLLIVPAATGFKSPGTVATDGFARALHRPCLLLDLSAGDPVERCTTWILGLLEHSGEPLDLNVAGPRESESPGIHAATTTLLRGVLDRVDQRHPEVRHPLPAGSRSATTV